LFFDQAEDGIRYRNVTGVQTCDLPIIHIKTNQKIINNYTINNIFDLALLSLLQDDVATDSHVVFNFKHAFTTSSAIWDYIQAFTPLNTTKFNLNKLSFEHKHSIPFKNS